MTISLSGRESKEEVITLLRKILQATMFPHLRMDQRESLIEHFAWMVAQKGDLQVNCRLETVPELQSTRVVLELGFHSLPPARLTQ